MDTTTLVGLEAYEKLTVLQSLPKTPDIQATYQQVVTTGILTQEQRAKLVTYIIHLPDSPEKALALAQL